MNNYQKIIQKIKEDQKNRPTCCVGPTGPRGLQGVTGPTHTLKSESKEKVL